MNAQRAGMFAASLFQFELMGRPPAPIPAPPSQCQIIGIIILHILRHPQHNRTIPNVSTLPPFLTPNTYLNIMNPFATTFAIPNQSVIKLAPSLLSGSSLTKYFNTITVTLPANPPAINANPKKRTNLAFHATPDPEYEKLSADNLVFSMELITSMPRAEQIKGIQSTKVMCTKEALRGE